LPQQFYGAEIAEGEAPCPALRLGQSRHETNSPDHEVARKQAGAILTDIFGKVISKMVSLKITAVIVAAATAGALFATFAPDFGPDLALVAVAFFG
jgi:hypothetical protein